MYNGYHDFPTHYFVIAKATETSVAFFVEKLEVLSCTSLLDCNFYTQRIK